MKRTDRWQTSPSFCPPNTYKYLLLILFILTLQVSTTRAQTFPPALKLLIEEARSNNAELLSLEDNVQALQAKAPASGSLTDPMVGFGLINIPTDTFDLDQEPMTQKLLFVSQKFPWFGTLSLQQQLTELQALKAHYFFIKKRLSISRQLAENWFDLGFISKSQEVNSALIAIVNQTARIAESRYSTGIGLQQDVLAGHVELSVLGDETVSLQNRHRAISASITGLLNRQGFDFNYQPDSLAEPGELPARDILIRAALQSNPEVITKKLAVDMARVEVELAEKDYYPDFDLRLSYGQRDENPVTGDDRADLVSFTLAMSVPLYKTSRQDSQLSSRQKSLSAAEKSLQGLTRSLPQAIDTLLAEITGARENLKLYRDVLSVQASHLAQSSLAAYSVGKVEFTTMLAARMQELRINLAREKYTYRIYKKMAELEELLGVSLSSLEDS